MNGKQYAVQVKRYKGNVGNKAIQEAFSAKAYYGCESALLITNSYFTGSAKDLAKIMGVELVNCQKLQKWLTQNNM